MLDCRQDENAISAAVERLRSGGLVVIPTETVYGLAGRTFDPQAIADIYALKGRSSDNPLIAHVKDSEAAKALTRIWPDSAVRLAERFWPGPMTLVLPRREEVPAIAAGGLDTLAIRVPSHPIAQSLLVAMDEPLSAPSANRSGAISPTCASHVLMDYQNVPEANGMLLLDGGVCDQGIESTVVDLTGSRPHILRPGSLGRHAIEETLGTRSDEAPPEKQAASPGTRARHYAPSRPILCVTPEGLHTALQISGAAAVISSDSHAIEPPHVCLLWSDDPSDAAKSLYDLMRRADSIEDCERIVVVLPPDEPAWEAIHDRLRRAVVPR